MLRDYPDQDARRVLGGAPVVLVTTRYRGTDNVMPVAWNTPLSNNPPLVGIVVHPSRHTYDMIRAAEEFAINVPGQRLMNHVQYMGSVSGRDLQKIEAARMPTFEARRIDAPLLEGCIAYIECGLEDALRVGDHVLFIGQVKLVSIEEEAFNETWLLEDDNLKPLHYLGLDYYAILGERMQSRLKEAAEAGAEQTLEEALQEALELEREEQEKRSERGEERG